MNQDTVLVVATELNPTVDRVMLEVNERNVRVMRFDLAAFPQRLALRGHHGHRWSGTLQDEHRTARLEEVRAVYFGRPDRPVADERIEEPYQTWARNEATAGIMGILYALPVTWINRPNLDAMASEKPAQLTAAAACGLRVPRSVVTNDPRFARDFAFSVNGPVVCKPLHGGPLHHPDGRRHGVPTHLVEPADIDDSVRLTAHLFQEWIEKDHEIRLTIVGDQMFAATIHARSKAAHVDWRTDYDALEYGVTDVPDDVRHGVLGWMKHHGLNFGAFDFAVTPGGDWVFFECNPCGAWAFIEKATGLPIASAIADLLTKGSA